MRTTLFMQSFDIGSGYWSLIDEAARRKKMQMPREEIFFVICLSIPEDGEDRFRIVPASRGDCWELLDRYLARLETLAHDIGTWIVGCEEIRDTDDVSSALSWKGEEPPEDRLLATCFQTKSKGKPQFALAIASQYDGKETIYATAGFLYESALRADHADFLRPRSRMTISFKDNYPLKTLRAFDREVCRELESNSEDPAQSAGLEDGLPTEGAVSLEGIPEPWQGIRELAALAIEKEPAAVWGFLKEKGWTDNDIAWLLPSREDGMSIDKTASKDWKGMLKKRTKTFKENNGIQKGRFKGE